MTDTYPQRVRDNILPLSVANTLPEAFKEWYFTEKTVDHEKPIEDCQLCNQERLRYHFQIKNDVTNNKLWVGSKCILKFEVSVYDKYGRALNEKDAKKKLNKLMQEMRLKSCLNSLRELAAKEKKRDILKSALDYYQKNGYLTPKFAFVVFWKLKQYNIDHKPSFFKISLRRQSYKDDLASMQTERVHFFWSALRSSQRRIAIELGHTPPKST